MGIEASRPRCIAVALAVAGLGLAACVPGGTSPPPAAPPPVCPSGASDAGALDAGGADAQDAALPLVAVTEDERGEVDVVTYGADGLADGVEFVEDLEADPDTEVVSVSIDEPVALLGPATDDGPQANAQWAFDNVTFEEAWPSGDGDGVTIAVLDTGVLATHQDLSAKIVNGVDFATLSGDRWCKDGHGHGTHVAGIAAAVTGNGAGVAGGAPDAEIMPVKVLDDSGSGWTSDVAAGIYWATDHGADVINMSLGGGAYSGSMHAAVQYAVSHGVVVVAAAGNSNSYTPSYPAAYAEVVAVASTTSSDTRSSFSNKGNHLDLSAPGSGIVSTYAASNSSYATLSGTSMASPYAAAAVAIVVDACPFATPLQVESALESTAVDLGSAGFDALYGHGLIDPQAAVLGC